MKDIDTNPTSVWATVEIEVGGPSDGTRSFTVPALWADRVKALEAKTTYGDGYQRGTLDELWLMQRDLDAGEIGDAGRKLALCELVRCTGDELTERADELFDLIPVRHGRALLEGTPKDQAE